MSKLHIDVKYSALYRPQSIGLLERQHRSLKEGLKAAIEDMGNKHQDKWLDYLPFVLLGRRVALQPDVGASASELTFGVNVRIPGQILYDPEEEDGPKLQEILSDVRNKTNRQAKQTSSHSLPEKPCQPIPLDVTHVYTRQHQTTGLQCPFEGPFEILERPSRSTVKIRVGQYQDGRDRVEIRHFNDLKLAHPDSMASPVSRPKLGRPATSSSDPSIATEATPVPKPPNRLLKTTSKQTSGSTGRVSTGGAADASQQHDSHATSSSGRQHPTPPPEGGKIQTAKAPHPDYIKKGPLITEQMFDKWTPELLNLPQRPVRSTRNPQPYYVDSFHRPWSASKSDIRELNEWISRRI